MNLRRFHPTRRTQSSRSCWPSRPHDFRLDGEAERVAERGGSGHEVGAAAAVERGVRDRPTVESAPKVAAGPIGPVDPPSSGVDNDCGGLVDGRTRQGEVATTGTVSALRRRSC